MQHAYTLHKAASYTVCIALELSQLSKYERKPRQTDDVGPE